MAKHIQYTLEVIQDEALYLVKRGAISRHQPIFVLSKYIPINEWIFVERELEERSFHLSDRINDLITNQKWDND